MPQASTLASVEVYLLSEAKGTNRPSSIRDGHSNWWKWPVDALPPPKTLASPGDIGVAVNFCRVPALQLQIFVCFFVDKTRAGEQGLPVRLSPAPLPCESSHIVLSHKQQARIPNVALSCLPPCCQDLSNTFRAPWKKWEPLGICVLFFFEGGGQVLAWDRLIWILICRGRLTIN